MYFSKQIMEKNQEEKLNDEEKNHLYDLQNNTDTISNKLGSKSASKSCSKSGNKLVSRQYIYSNNYKKSEIINDKFIGDNIFSNDIDIENKIYNLITNPYQKKINLMNLVLDSDLHFPLNNYLDIIKFFNWLNPLTIEYKMASGCWNIKSVKYGNKTKILLQNSISKVDLNEHFNLKYINKIKKVLSNAGIKYYYFEFKSKRFNKIKDIIWVFEKN